MTFVPLCAWTLRVLVRQQLLRRVHVAYALLAGLLVHAVLLVSLIAFEWGAFGEPFLVAVQVANGFLPLAFATLAGAVMPAAPTIGRNVRVCSKGERGEKGP